MPDRYDSIASNIVNSGPQRLAESIAGALRSECRKSAAQAIADGIVATAELPDDAAAAATALGAVTVPNADMIATL